MFIYSQVNHTWLVRLPVVTASHPVRVLHIVHADIATAHPNTRRLAFCLPYPTSIHLAFPHFIACGAFPPPHLAPP